MNDNKFLLVIAGLLAIGIFGSLKQKNLLPSIQSSRPFPDEWLPNTTQPPAQIPPSQPPINTRSYKEAVELSVKTNKPILLFFASSNCPPCVRMKTELAPSIAQSQDKFIYQEINTDTEKDLVTKYKITSTPSYLIINGNEQVMKRGSGYLSVQDFANWLAAPYQPELQSPTPPAQPPQQPKPQPKPSPGGS